MYPHWWWCTPYHRSKGPQVLLRIAHLSFFSRGWSKDHFCEQIYFIGWPPSWYQAKFECDRRLEQISIGCLIIGSFRPQDHQRSKHLYVSFGLKQSILIDGLSRDSFFQFLSNWYQSLISHFQKLWWIRKFEPIMSHLPYTRNWRVVVEYYYLCGRRSHVRIQLNQ